MDTLFNFALQKYVPKFNIITKLNKPIHIFDFK